MRERQRDYALRVARERLDPWTAQELDAAIKSDGYAAKLFLRWIRRGLAKRLPPLPAKRTESGKVEAGRPPYRFAMVRTKKALAEVTG